MSLMRLEFKKGGRIQKVCICMSWFDGTSSSLSSSLIPEWCPSTCLFLHPIEESSDVWAYVIKMVRDGSGLQKIFFRRCISGEGKMCVSLSAAILNTLLCIMSYCIAYIAFISFCAHAIMATNQKASCCCISDSFKWHILCGSNIHAIQKWPFCCNGILVFAK